MSKLIKVAELVQQVSFPEKLVSPKSYKILGVKWYGKGLFIKNELKGSEIKANVLYKVKKGNFIYNRLFAWKGSFAIVTEDFDGCYVSNEFPQFEPKGDEAVSVFLNYFYSQEFIWKQIEKQSSGVASISRNRYKERDFLATLVPKFETSEVANVVNKLSVIEKVQTELSNTLFQKEQKIKLLRQAILQEAVQGKLTLQVETDEPVVELLKRIKAEKQKLLKEGKLKKEKELPPIIEEEIPFALPKGWVWCRGDDIASFIDPQPSHRTPPEFPNGVPYIGMSEVREDGTIDFNNARKVSFDVLKVHQERYSLEKGDFIFGKIGTIGKPTFLPEPFDYTLSANIILIKPFKVIVDPKFISFYLQSPLAKSLLTNQSTNSTHLVFGIKKARLLLFPVPPISVQLLIVAKVEQALCSLNQLERQIASSQAQVQQLLQAVLKEAFEGKRKEYIGAEGLTLAAEV